MKKWYLVAIILVIAALITTLSYNLDVPSLQPSKIITTREYKWILTGASFITTYNDNNSPVSGAKTSHICLAGNDESCFLITIWSGSYESYFTAYWTTMFNKMIAESGSTVTKDDLTAQLQAGYHDALTVSGSNGSLWHVAEIGMEQLQLYTERPWGTIIVTDTLGLK